MNRDAPYRSRAIAPIVLLAALVLVAAACGSPSGGDPSVPRPVLAVATVTGGAVAVFETTGDTADMQRTRLFSVPTGHVSYSAAAGPDERFYVASSTTGTITVVAIADAVTGGGPATTFFPPARTFSSPDMQNPFSLAFDARGDLWVADGRGSLAETPIPSRLLRFTDLDAISDGAVLPAATILDFAYDPDGYWHNHLVYAIYIDDDDRLWYSDYFGWTIGRIDGLAGRAAVEADVVPDLQILTFDPDDPQGTAIVRNPVGIALSDAGALYVGSHEGEVVYRFDGAATWSGFHPSVAPDAELEVGIPTPRFVAIDAEGDLWALTNGTDARPGRDLVRVTGHAEPSGSVALTPTHRLTWAPFGVVLGGGMRFVDR